MGRQVLILNLNEAGRPAGAYLRTVRAQYICIYIYVYMYVYVNINK